MRLLPLLEVIGVNVVLVALFLWVTGDYAFRTYYWGTEGFAPATARYPLFFITSAAKGSTSIPGLLTVDWQQILALLLILTDVIYVSTLLRARRREGLKALTG